MAALLRRQGPVYGGGRQRNLNLERWRGGEIKTGDRVFSTKDPFAAGGSVFPVEDPVAASNLFVLMAKESQLDFVYVAQLSKALNL